MQSEANERRLRVVVADDHSLLRQGQASMLEAHGFEVVAQAADADELIAKVGVHRPDVVMTDIRMPPTHSDDGLRAAAAIRRAHPQTGVLVLSQYVEAGYALALIGDDARGVGYLLKDRIADFGAVADALRRVAAGGSVLDPEVVRWMLGGARDASPLAELTEREREVLGLLAEGCSNQGAARRLGVSERAVAKHVTSILSKLGLPEEAKSHRRVLAVLAYLQDERAVPRPVADAPARPTHALSQLASEGATVCLLSVEPCGHGCWSVLKTAGVRLLKVRDVPGAIRALSDPAVQVVVADAGHGAELTAALRAREDLASTHIVLCARLDSADELRAALDAGADDVMRIPFEPEVLAARVTAGLRAARLRANEALLRSLVANIPGAVYRCACDEDWTMQWLSDEIERITGYPAHEFIASSVRTFASVIHPDDREQVERSVMDAVDAGRPYMLEYRVQRPDGSLRWVLERGQAQDAGDGRRWLDGAIFDITARRAAEQALREHELVETRLAEVHASRARILEAADRARREIERNLHDGAQQRFVSIALQLQSWASAQPQLTDQARTELGDVLAGIRTGLAELRDLAHGLHPAVLTDRGLADAISSLGHRAPVPVDVRVGLNGDRLPIAIESAAYFTVCEALTNVAKYAHATHAWVDVQSRNGHLDIEVGDDGIGGADPHKGSGLQGLRDRIAAVNGTLHINSPRAAGTILRAQLPVHAPPHVADSDAGQPAVSTPMTAR
jgi:PAS domain S-box-containing protein